MHFSKVALLACMAFTASANPHPEFEQTQALPTHLLNREEARHAEPSTNVTLHPRADNGLCKDLELPTEATYTIGYESFCTKYVPDDRTTVMGPGSRPLVATFMLGTHIGTTIPWIFKIWGTETGSQPLYLTRDVCISNFRDMLESERAKLGTNYCIVDGSGGNGESKEFWGQGFVLVMEMHMVWMKGDVNQVSKFEARKRKGKFDTNNPDGKD